MNNQEASIELLQQKAKTLNIIIKSARSELIKVSKEIGKQKINLMKSKVTNKLKDDVLKITNLFNRFGNNITDKFGSVKKVFCDGVGKVISFGERTIDLKNNLVNKVNTVVGNVKNISKDKLESIKAYFFNYYFDAYLRYLEESKKHQNTPIQDQIDKSVGIIREENKINYTKVSNELLKDKELSLPAKGLLITMLSLPDDWSYSTLGLTSIVKESKNTIHRLLKELESKNYLIRKPIRDDKGRFVKYDYVIYELPYPNVRNMDISPDTQIWEMDHNKLNNNKDEIDKTLPSGYTSELIRRGFISENDFELDKYNTLFDELKKEYDYQLIYMCSNYIIKMMKLNKNKDEYDNPIEDKYNYFKTSLINNLRYITQDISLWDFDDDETS